MLMLCDTPGSRFPFFANDMAAITSVVHLRKNGFPNTRGRGEERYIQVDEKGNTGAVHLPGRI
jgi:hypothetical protein